MSTDEPTSSAAPVTPDEARLLRCPCNPFRRDLNSHADACLVPVVDRILASRRMAPPEPRVVSTQPHLPEIDPQPRLREGESQTAFAVRCVKAEAWAEGAAKASPYGGGYLRSILVENPYLDGDQPPDATTGGAR